MKHLIHAILIVICLAALTVSAVVGQEHSEALFIIDVNGKRGFIDRNGKVVVQPVFEDLRNFKDGKAPAQTNGKWGFIDRSGKFIIDPAFDEIRWSFSEGLTPVLIGEKWGYIDQTGKIVIEPTLDYGHSFSEGRAVINIGKDSDLGHGLIDLQGKRVTNQKFEWSGWGYNEGLLNVKVDEKWGYIDRDAKFVILPKFNNARGFSDGLAAVEFNRGKSEWGYIDKAGNIVIPPSFEDASYFKEGLAPVQRNGKYGYINKSGKIVIEPQFERGCSFWEGLACVIDAEGKYGYIDRSGIYIVKPIYDRAFSFENGLAWVSFGKWEGGLGYHIMPTYNGVWGYIDKSGKEVWKPTK